jgi:uncharacterized protein
VFTVVPDPTLAAIFVLGLLSGVHCIGMCGGIVAALGWGGGSARSWLLLLGYNAGRISSYAIAGAAVGSIGGLSLLLDHVFPIQTALRVLANVLLIAAGMYLLGLRHLLTPLEQLGSRLWRRVQPLTKRVFPARTVPRAVVLGMLWGWLPCGMVYSVLATALAAGSGPAGAGLMLAFGVGTIPSLVLSGMALRPLVTSGSRAKVRLLAGALVLVFGVIGLIQAHPAAHSHTARPTLLAR